MKTFTDVTRQDVENFIKAKISKGGECPSCGTNNWIRDQLGDDVFPCIPSAKIAAPNIIPGRNYPVFILSCSNCGLVTQHMIGAVVRWLNEVENEKQLSLLGE